MIDRNEIEGAIERLESEELTYESIAKLADLYSLRDHLKGTSVASHFVGESEFLQLCSHAPIEGVLNILDEHMECIKILYPKEYNLLIKKLSEL